MCCSTARNGCTLAVLCCLPACLFAVRASHLVPFSFTRLSVGLTACLLLCLTVQGQGGAVLGGRGLSCTGSGWQHSEACDRWVGGLPACPLLQHHVMRSAVHGNIFIALQPSWLHA